MQEVLAAKVERHAEQLVDIILSAARHGGMERALGLMRREGGTGPHLTRATGSMGAREASVRTCSRAD